MKYVPLKRARVLAVDPNPKGFGFVVLEHAPLQFVDWGVACCGRNPRRRLKAVTRLVDRYHPDTIVLEDPAHAVASRQRGLHTLLGLLSDAAEPSGVRLLTYPRHVVRAAFAPAGVHTKSAVAELLAARFPELLPRLPRPRQNWESEDPRMAIFDATALALTHLRVSPR